MTITYHSQNRKELVKAISEIIGIPAVYQFMPTCAYQIGECYTVTKAGDLEISDQADRKETERLLAELANRGYAVPDTSDNPKYTMRCFLIRLGMVGAEFKAARKVILRNLTGNSAFRKVGDTDAVSE